MWTMYVMPLKLYNDTTSVKFVIRSGALYIYIYFKAMITRNFRLYCASVTAVFTRTSNCTVKPAHFTKNKYNTKYKPNYNTQFEFEQFFNILRYSNLLLHPR